MAEFLPRNPDFLASISDSFARQGLMHTLGAELGDIRPGIVEIRLPFSPGLTQQHGFIHAGAVASIIDSAGGYAAFSLFEAGDGVLTVEFKLNLLSPAAGEVLIARGQVVRPGRTLTVTTGEVVAVKNGVEIPCAVMQQTIMRIVGRPEVVE